uniref:Transcriptional regulator n=1 Tax=Ascaris lumbricoides TaxID=6252 RepID=A0A0M3IGW0_ASCLU
MIANSDTADAFDQLATTIIQKSTGHLRMDDRFNNTEK